MLISEGYPVCHKGKLRIEVKMCAPDAIEKVARAWGTPVRQKRERVCNITPYNPTGQPYITQAVGERARLILERYRQKGLLTQEFEQKIAKTPKKCRKA